MKAEKRRIPDLLIFPDDRKQTVSLHILRNFQAMEIQDRRGDIYSRGKLRPAPVLYPAHRIIDEQRRVADLLIGRHNGLAPPVMFPQQESMIRIHNQHGILPKIVLIHGIQHLAQVTVAHGHQGRI